MKGFRRSVHIRSTAAKNKSPATSLNLADRKDGLMMNSTSAPLPFIPPSCVQICLGYVHVHSHPLVIYLHVMLICGARRLWCYVLEKNATYQYKSRILSVEHGGRSIMDWVCFEARRLAVINGTMYSELYPFILQENVRTFGRETKF